MNQSEAFYYPRSYYRDIAFFCSNYMTRIFSPGLMIFMFDQNDGWQDQLRAFIEKILFKSRLDDSVAIGAMTLLETFRNGPHEKPTYPNPNYLEYFLGAYILTHRYLSRRPMRRGFWHDVVGGLYTECELQKIEQEFTNSLGGRVRIGKSHFLDMKVRMYAFIRTHMSLRSGGSYTRNVASEPGDSPPWKTAVIGNRGPRRTNTI